jgi:5-methylcytosine-specific restriction endonuclease McrA
LKPSISPTIEVRIHISLKPCIKCGVVDRNSSGACRNCKRTWTINNSEKKNKSTIKWRAENKEKFDASLAKYRSEHKEERRLYAIEYRKKFPEKKKKYEKQYALRKPDCRRVILQNYRAKKRLNGGTLSKDISSILLIKQKEKCVSCMAPLINGYHIDHIYPIALGGSNTDQNIQLLCPKCNRQKHSKHPIDFMQERGFLL